MARSHAAPIALSEGHLLGCSRNGAAATLSPEPMGPAGLFAEGKASWWPWQAGSPPCGLTQSHSTALTNSAGRAAPPQAETPACSSQGTQHKALQGSSLVLTCTTLSTLNIKTLHRKKYLQIVQNYPAAFSNAIQVLLTRPVTLLLTAPVSNMQSWERSLAHPHLHGLGMMHRGTQGSL